MMTNETLSIKILHPEVRGRLGKIRHALFDFDGTLSVLREGWETIVRGMAAAPGTAVDAIVAAAGFGVPPAEWQGQVGPAVARAAADAYDDDPRRIARLATGRLMAQLRGKVPAVEVVAAVRANFEATDGDTTR